MTTPLSVAGRGRAVDIGRKVNEEITGIELVGPNYLAAEIARFNTAWLRA